MNYLCLLLSLLDNLGCGSGIKASFMPLTSHEISASFASSPWDLLQVWSEQSSSA